MEKHTGMIRKLDEVGRIVIPKEIRKYLRLDEGSPLEIDINSSGEVVLKKFDQLDKLEKFAKLFGLAISKYMPSQILFTDKEKVIDAYPNKISGKVTASVHNVIIENVTYYACEKDKTSLVPVLLENSVTYKSIIIVPIMSDEPIGSIISLSEKECEEMHSIKFLEFVSKVYSLLEG